LINVTVSSSIPEAFTGSSLTLGASPAFNGQIVGFAGYDALQGSDQIGLRGTNFNSIHSAYDSSTSVLAVTDGTNTRISTSSEMTRMTISNSRTTVTAEALSMLKPAPASFPCPMATLSRSRPPATAQPQVRVRSSSRPNFGQVTISNFTSATDTIEISKTAFANIVALLAATHDDAHGNAVITDAAHNTITIQNVTSSELLASRFSVCPGTY
jgi:serralysin